MTVSSDLWIVKFALWLWRHRMCSRGHILSFLCLRLLLIAQRKEAQNGRKRNGLINGRDKCFLIFSMLALLCFATPSPSGIAFGMLLLMQLCLSLIQAFHLPKKEMNNEKKWNINNSEEEREKLVKPLRDHHEKRFTFFGITFLYRPTTTNTQAKKNSRKKLVWRNWARRKMS